MRERERCCPSQLQVTLTEQATHAFAPVVPVVVAAIPASTPVTGIAVSTVVTIAITFAVAVRPVTAMPAI